MAVLKLDGVHFSYGARPVLEGVSCDVRAGELLVILGPSGSGKSTFLRLVAGLDAPNGGTISLNERPASAGGRILIEPAARHVSLVFQDLALWPHLTCDEQLQFMGPDLELADRKALLRNVGLEDFESRLPADMSGGERQRLALARALAAKPQLLLLDEPFANLEPGLRHELRRLLLELHRDHLVSMVYVTHDLEDAFGLADRIVVLNQGKLEQDGPPEDIYRRPASAFVARFVGKAAIVPAAIEGTEIRTPLGGFTNPRPDLANSSGIEVVLRPESIEVGEGGFQARVEEVIFAGDRYLILASTETGPIWTYVSHPPARGETVGLRVRHGWPLPPRSTRP